MDSKSPLSSSRTDIPNTATAHSPPPNGKAKSTKQRTTGFQSEGVKDNDIFNLPSSDWQLLAFLTVLASVIRLFRLTQPTSVVFDEVQ
jgi:dolichyl-phosphate-mannose-protein mannosyltransferase